MSSNGHRDPIDPSETAIPSVPPDVQDDLVRVREEAPELYRIMIEGLRGIFNNTSTTEELKERIDAWKEANPEYRTEDEEDTNDD